MILFIRNNRFSRNKNKITNKISSSTINELNFNKNSRLFEYIKERDNENLNNKKNFQYNDDEDKNFEIIINNDNKNSYQINDTKLLKNQENSIGESYSSIPLAHSKCNNLSSLCIRSNDANTVNQINLTSLLANFDIVIDLIKKTQNLLKKQRINHKTKENGCNAITEWKEVAHRVDIILFYISSFVTLAAPLILFGKYPFRSVEPSQNSCSCDYNL
jgi:hypothetical protein